MADAQPVSLDEYDVIHVEDGDFSDVVSMYADIVGLSYRNVVTLFDLEKVLGSSIAKKMYIIDGRFPVSEEEPRPVNNSQKAIALIQKHAQEHGYAPNIAIYSSAPEQIAIAKSLGVKFFKKAYDMPDKVLTEMLGQVND